MNTLKTKRYRVFGTVSTAHDCDCDHCDHYEERTVDREINANSEDEAIREVVWFYDDEDDGDDLEVEFLGEIPQDIIMKWQKAPTLPGMVPA